MSKYCKECGALNENPLLKYCKKHYWGHQEKKKQKAIPRISKKKIERLKKGQSEKKLFKEIALERAINGKVYCEKCGKEMDLKIINHWNFDHIKTKGARTDLKLNKENIQILCVACHFLKTNGQKLKTNFLN